MKQKIAGLCLAFVLALSGALAPVAPTTAYAQSSITAQKGSDGLTDYEREQQNLPLSQRDKLVAEPRLMLAAVVLLTWFVWKMRRDIKAIKLRNEAFDRERAQAERMLIELEAKEAAEGYEEADEDDGDEDDGDENETLPEASLAEPTAAVEDGEHLKKDPAVQE